MEQMSQPKWEGKVCTSLTNATANQVWHLYKDFFNFHKWFPSLDTCYGIHGTNSELGCIRYCAGFSIPSNDGDKPIVPQGDEGDQDGCMIEWSFTVNKMEGWVLDDLVRKYEYNTKPSPLTQPVSLDSPQALIDVACSRLHDPHRHHLLAASWPSSMSPTRHLMA
uniref:Uncharacterized protein n=1 Tax=Fagus sylvatica TaxID=28930 RepID=A0A2N9GIC2_FAGSY